MAAQISALLRDIKDAELVVESSLSPDAFRARVQPGSILRLESTISLGNVILEKTKASVLDESNNPSSLSYACGTLSLDQLFLSRETEDDPTFDIVARGKLFCFPLSKTVVSAVPISVEQLATWVQAAAEGSSPPEKSDVPQSKLPSQTPSGKPSEKLDPVASEDLSDNLTDPDPEVAPEKPPSKASSDTAFRPSVRFDATFDLEPGANIQLNEGTVLSVAENGAAKITLTGVQDYAVATVTGVNLILTSALLSTGPSDIDLRVTLNRREGGTHVLAFDKCTLRDVQFKPEGFTPPPLPKLRLAASVGEDGGKTYDFVVTVDPNNDFTVDMLIAQIKRRVGNPAVIATLQQKLTEKASAAATTAEVPSVITLSSAHWNIVDYATHEGKGQALSALELPHIRLALEDPAIKALARDAIPHLRLFMVATQLQATSQYDRVHLVEMARLLLTPAMSAAIASADPDVLPDLLRFLGLTRAEAAAVVRGGGDAAAPAPDLSRVETFLKSVSGGDLELAGRIAPFLVRAGNALNAQQRTRLRGFWVDAGGMEENGRAYVLLASFIEALHAGISADADAPASLRALLPLVPTGAALHSKIAVAADNLRGAIWASQNVVPDGWGPISERLEASVLRLYGDLAMPGGRVPRGGSAAFRAQAARAEQQGDKFFPGEVRFVGNGEEFFQQIAKLMDDTAAAAEGESAKGAIVLNHWSFEAIYATETGRQNVWGVRIAERLRDLAMDGFDVSIVVDEKNGPSRRGQVALQRMAAEVAADGRGSFACHAWLPRKERFPLGSHVKYFVTPIGVIAGGSNLGDHYAHWSDSNFLLRGRDAVRVFAAHHDAILAEQRAVGLEVAAVPRVAPRDPALWEPLATHAHHDEDAAAVFQERWARAGVRVFRDQGGDLSDRILVEHIAALDCARGADNGRPAQTVYIANAYFALPQPLDEHPFARSLLRALQRGVNVEVMTNTVDSIDQPIVAGPIVKSVFLILQRARAIARAAAERGGTAGTFTGHLPSADYIGEDPDGIPEVLIHDKLLFFENIALVGTHNLHPRSFTMEQELVTEFIGDVEPPRGEEHEAFLKRTRSFFKHMMHRPGGDRIVSLDEVMAPLEWVGDAPPALWGPAGLNYALFQEKKWLYCHSYSSRTDEEVTKVEGLLDVSTKASFPDLIINAF